MNLLPNNTTSQTINGLKVTINKDKSITINGTSSANTILKLNNDDFNIASGEYVLNGFNMPSTVGKIDLLDKDANRIAITEATPSTFSVVSNVICKYARLVINANQTLNNQTFYPKLEKNSVPTPYSPYGCGNINEKIQNKNFAKLNEEIKTISGIDLKDRGVNYTVTDTIEFDGTVTGSAALTLFLSTINLLPDTYRLTVDVISGNISSAITISLRDENNEVIDNVNISNTGASKTITTTKETKYIGTYLAVGKVFNKYKIRIQLEKGSTSTEFQPHAEQNISFPLEEGQVFAQNDYIDDDGIHHVRQQKIYNGSEDWRQWSASLENVERFYLNIDGSKLNKDTLTNRFSYELSTGDYEHFRYSTTQGKDSQFVLFINKSRLETVNVAGLKKWLQENLLEIEYELAEEVVEPFTEEQARVWEQIKKIKTYKNVTHISSEDETPATMDMVYVRDLQTYLDNLNTRIEVLESEV